MNNIYKNKLHRAASIACGFLVAGGLLLTAMAFPKYYCQFNDKNTLNKVIYMDIQINPFEADYLSFAEKIHALAHAATNKDSLHAVQMNEAEIKISRKELTKIANAEIQKLKQLAIINTKIKLKVKKMAQCQRYIIYDTKENNNMKGISCWLLVYKNKKKTVKIYLDEEYHKIYSLKITYNNNSIIDTDSLEGYSEDENSTRAISKVNPWEWCNYILQYYDLLNYSKLALSDETVSDDDVLIGFHEQEQDKEKDPKGQSVINSIDYITISRIYYYDESDNPSWLLGIFMEEMIHF